MLERIVSLEIEDAYTKIKAAFTEQKCKVQNEAPSTQICFKQGSLWGISPQTAKKTITVDFEQAENGAKVRCSSKLASDWKNITLIGCVFALVLVGVCVWMASDLSSFLVTRQPSFWSWLVTVGVNVNLVATQALINLTWGLAIFLSVIILLEVAVVIYVRAKIDVFAENILKQQS